MFLFLAQWVVILSVTFWPFGTGDKDSEVKKTSLEIPKGRDAEVVRIALLQNISEATLSTDAPFRVRDSQGRSLFRGDRIVKTKVKAAAQGGIQLGIQSFRTVPLVIQTEEGAIKLDNHVYRSTLEIWPELNGKISVVNEIDLEDYLKGVLPVEANPKWDLEALKAQAVAARTYALFKAVENQDKRFVLGKDVLSQVYAGKSSENPVTDQAVEATQGQILTYRGKLFPAYFHSTCGGGTTHAEYIWNVEPHPSLKGVKCSFCWASKHYRWSETIPLLEIEAALKKNGIKISEISEIRLKDIDATGRARKIGITGAQGKITVHSNDFRLWIGPAKLRSTLIASIERKEDQYSFRGRGWGHGVGLCQYGMKQLAELGYTYPQILQYYYPEAVIETLNPLEE